MYLFIYLYTHIMNAGYTHTSITKGSFSTTCNKWQGRKDRAGLILVRFISENPIVRSTRVSCVTLIRSACCIEETNQIIVIARILHNRITTFSCNREFLAHFSIDVFNSELKCMYGQQALKNKHVAVFQAVFCKLC